MVTTLCYTPAKTRQGRGVCAGETGNGTIGFSCTFRPPEAQSKSRGHKRCPPAWADPHVALGKRSENEKESDTHSAALADGACASGVNAATPIELRRKTGSNCLRFSDRECQRPRTDPVLDSQGFLG